jgi:stage V sporulation protein B
VISETFFVSITRIFFLFLKPVRGIVLGRLLGPALYGMMNIPVPYIQIFVILSNIGFNTAIVKLMPDHIQAGRSGAARMIYRSAVSLTVTLSLVWTALLLLFAPRIARDLAHNPEAVGPIIVYALIIPFMAVNALYAAVYLAVQRGKLRAKITAVHGLLNIALPIACALLWHRRVTPVIAGFLTAELVGAAIFFIFFNRKILKSLAKVAAPIFAGAREMAGFGFLFFFASLGWNMLNSIDRLMVTYYLPIEQYGFYSMAAQVITAFSIVAATTGVALVPSLTVARSSGDAVGFDRQIQNTTRFAFLAIVPAVALAFVLSGDLFGILLPSFVPAVPIIKILAFIGFVDIMCRVGWASLVACGRGGGVASAYISAAIWNVLWNRLLIPRYGLVGAAAATLSSFVLLALLLQLMMRRASGTNVRPINLLHPFLASLVYWLIDRMLHGQWYLVRIPVILLGGSAAYVTLVLLTGLVRKADLEGARKALEPRSSVPHVALALWLLGLLERYRVALRRESSAL